MEDSAFACDYEQNFVKYILAVKKTTKQTLEEAFSLLYKAWGCGRSYERLEDFCTEALGWRREDLINIFSEAQMRHFSISSGSKSLSSSSTIFNSAQCSPTKAIHHDPFHFHKESSASLGVKSVFEGAHIIRTSTVKSRQTSQASKVANNKEGVESKRHSYIQDSCTSVSPNKGDDDVFFPTDSVKSKPQNFDIVNKTYDLESLSKEETDGTGNVMQNTVINVDPSVTLREAVTNLTERENNDGEVTAERISSCCVAIPILEGNEVENLNSDEIYCSYQYIKSTGILLSNESSAEYQRKISEDYISPEKENITEIGKTSLNKKLFTINIPSKYIKDKCSILPATSLNMNSKVLLQSVHNTSEDNLTPGTTCAYKEEYVGTQEIHQHDQRNLSKDLLDGTENTDQNLHIYDSSDFPSHKNIFVESTEKLCSCIGISCKHNKLDYVTQRGQKTAKDLINVSMPVQVAKQTNLESVCLVQQFHKSSSDIEDMSLKDISLQNTTAKLDTKNNAFNNEKDDCSTRPASDTEISTCSSQVERQMTSRGCFPPKSFADIIDIIQDDAQLLHCTTDDPLGCKTRIDLSQTNFLHAEPDPCQLSEKILVLMLTEIFPDIPPKVTQLLQRLRRTAYVVCHLDNKFDSTLLKRRLQDLYQLSCDLISVFTCICKDVTTKHIRKTSRKLRASKRRLRRAKKSYQEHLDWLIKTRHELHKAERELLQAEDKNDKILKDFSSLPNSPCTESTEIYGDVFLFQDVASNLEENVSQGTADSFNISSMSCVDSTSCEKDTARNKCSLLSCVMEEVAVIERKHSSPTDVKLKKLLRSTRQSIIMTKKSIRDRLDTNVSAEQESIAKEDEVNERQLETDRLNKRLQKTLKSQKVISDCEISLKTCIRTYLKKLPDVELNICDFKDGIKHVKAVRSSKHGRFLMESRREAMSFASRVRIFDLGKWLFRKEFAKREVQSIYSLVSVKESNEPIHLTELLRTDDSGPSMIFLCGPKGSGKTCMCHFILNEWKSNKYSGNTELFGFDLVLYTTLNNILSSGSWSQYLREHVFYTTLNDFSDADIHDSLNSLTILFLLDVGSQSSETLEILNDIFQNIGRNKVVVTARSGSELELVNAVKKCDRSFVLAKLCPMERDALTEFTSTLFSKEELKRKNIKDFIDIIDSMKVTDSLLYPLYVTYLVYLWDKDPGYTVHSTSVSRLFTRVLMLCQQSVVKQSNPEESEVAKITAERYSHELCKGSWKLLSQDNGREEQLVIFEAEHDFFKAPSMFDHFHPLIIVRESSNGKQQGVLLHYCLTEVLCGYYIAARLLLQKKGIIQRRQKLDVYFKPNVERFRYVFPHIAGTLVYNKHSVENARVIVSFYRKALTTDVDVISWLTFLKECEFLPSVCTAVSEVLSQTSTWSVASHSRLENCAVADLLRRGAYHPKLVIIVNIMPKKVARGCGSGIDCIIRALSTCASTLVHLRQELQFYTWGEKMTSDAQVIPLQPPGTLQDFWGHLGIEGAMALRHSHHLEELNVRISSCEALTALSQSLDNLQQSLKYLYLRLDLPTSTSTSSLQSLTFKGKQLWLRMRGINDDSVSWLIDVTKRLSNWYSEIVLEESRLSPPLLHTLKALLPNTPVFAWDQDGSSINKRVVFRIQHGAQDKFVMEADTGIISVAQGALLDPDRTEPRATTYILEVIALDGGIGNAQLQARTVVNITILDVNNKPPVFIDPGTVRVAENEIIGFYVHRVEAVDLDARPRLRYSIDIENSEARNELGAIVKPTEYNYAEAFEIGEVEGVIRTKGQLDRERVEVIRLALICEDIEAATGKQTATATLTVIIEDKNDNNPQFRKSLYRRSVAENAKKGTTIVTVVADDVDKNRTITYTLQGSLEVLSLVDLDRETGEIVVSERVDREQFSWLNFTVKATDSGVPPRSNQVDVLVQIIDENDNNPVFINPPSNLTIREDAPPGTSVAIVSAVDPDSDDYGRITYLLDRKSSDGKFKVI
ncbi:Cadherin-23 [Halocaridina rubra]|uniref:Cadherin-23 n=1 Tax=Halocaridina rubra TaxID=373956 RepID=A0AAN8WNC4_HALRR